MTNKLISQYFDVDVFNSSSSKILDGDLRLNAEFYLHSNSYELSEKIQTVKLSEIANVVWFGPFKRHYINDLNFGVPLITSSEMMELIPSCEGIISKTMNRNYEKYLVSSNTILVSCSGTIGNVTLVDGRLNNMAISQDAMRVSSKSQNDIGLIYTFFKSEYGQSLIKGKKGGAVIDHIYKNDLDSLDIPIVSENIRCLLTDKILSSSKKRDDANLLLGKANTLVLKYNNLPPLSSIKRATLDADGEVEIRMTALDEFESNWRLDAHFYNNNAQLIVNNIRNNASDFSELKNLCEDIILGKRFKRNYVESDHGTPFIGSKNILQIRPTELKYLSNSEISFMDDLMLKPGMILIACSGSLGGTFGKTCLVHKNFENYAASQHILRIVPNNRTDAGYLYAYLSSDYGYYSITRYRWGALIDEIDDEDMAELIIPICDIIQQKEIGDLVRHAYELREEANRLEDEAQDLLTQALTQA